ncbi:cation-transporting P-type ATPase, partial [Clostridium sp.]
MEKFFSKPASEILKTFNVSKEGLNDSQTKENLSKYGYNQLSEKKK